MRRLLFLLATLLIALSTTVGAFAQSSATVTGIATDGSGANIPGANITVTEQATSVTHIAKANGSGEYSVPLLPPGVYTVKASAPGFSERLINRLVLQVGQTARLDLKLEVGSANASVEVSAVQVATDTETSSTGTVIENRTVVDMPLNGRQFYTLALLVPGTYLPVQGFRGGFNVAGSSEIPNFFTLDGFNNVDGANGSPTVRPSIDDIQEFRLQTGVYAAEYGHNNGGQVTVITKSGTNKFHGTAYDFLRNDVMDAVNYFTGPGTRNSLSETISEAPSAAPSSAIRPSSSSATKACGWFSPSPPSARSPPPPSRPATSPALLP